MLRISARINAIVHSATARALRPGVLSTQIRAAWRSHIDVLRSAAEHADHLQRCAASRKSRLTGANWTTSMSNVSTSRDQLGGQVNRLRPTLLDRQIGLLQLDQRIVLPRPDLDLDPQRVQRLQARCACRSAECTCR